MKVREFEHHEGLNSGNCLKTYIPDKRSENEDITNHTVEYFHLNNHKYIP